MRGPPLGYFRPAPAGVAGRRPVSVTVIAWVGIAICSLVLFVVISGVGSGPNASGSLLQGGSAGAAAEIGFLVGFLLRWSFYFLMLAGCVGLLMLRPAARWLVIVCAYAWVVLTVLEIGVVVYAVKAVQTAPRAGGVASPWLGPAVPSAGELLVFFAVACAIGIAFPFSALAVLRRPRVVQFFRGRVDPSAAPPPPGTIEKAAAWSALLVGSFLFLNEFAHFIVWITRDTRQSGEGVYLSARYALAGVVGTAAPMLFLHVASRAALVVAAMMAIRRQPASRVLMIIACLAAIVLESARLTTFADPARVRSAPSPTDGLLDWFIAVTRNVGLVLRSAFAYVLLMLIFLRPAADPHDDEPADAEIIA